MTGSSNFTARIRHELRPGDLGRVTEMHGVLYEHEYGFNIVFEGYVAEGIGRFGHGHDPARERLWVAERSGKLVGSAAIVAGEGGLAQFRWFLAAPDSRGQGLGSELISASLDFAQAAGYAGVYLWTVHVLPDAARLYLTAGFELTETLEWARLWGRDLKEQRYDLRF
ncbi:MAG: GNAT family N-acetyltransferase [Chloroflexota bacterium]